MTANRRGPIAPDRPAGRARSRQARVTGRGRANRRGVNPTRQMARGHDPDPATDPADHDGARAPAVPGALREDFTRRVLMAASRIYETPAGNPWWAPNPDDSIKGRARKKQRPPTGDWFVWIVRTGRGFGKTRTMGEWLDLMARTKCRPGDQVLIAGRTPSDVRVFALEGPGGLLKNHPDLGYEPANRKVLWPNGVVGIIRSGANPEEFRGFSGQYAWLDEFAAWSRPQECWDNLLYGMREGEDPRIGISTTPRPIKLLREIEARPSTIVVTGSSDENAANLAEKYVREVLDPRRGTRLGRQEIDGEILEDIPGALWSLDLIQETRVPTAPELVRILVGVDPQGTKDVGHETGIVAVGIGADGHIYVIEDGSINGSPNEWGSRAVAVWERKAANAIAAEANYGGEMVRHTIQTVKDSIPVELVTATRGKRVRAEPIAAMYEQGKAHNVGTFPALEDEMVSFTPGGSSGSPNRMDAMVWAATGLLFSTKKKRQRRLVWGTGRVGGGGRR